MVSRRHDGAASGPQPADLSIRHEGAASGPQPRGRFSRSVLSALAAMVAAAVPSLLSGTALAAPPDGDPQGGTTATAAPADAAKHEAAKHAKKAHAVKAQKPKHKAEAAAKPQEADKPAAPAQKTAAAKAKKTKKTASRGAPKKKAAKKGDSDSPRRPCFGPAVAIDRGGLEAESFPLLDCKGKPLDDARAHLSVLARPWGAARPDLPLGGAAKAAKGKGQAAREKDAEVAPGVRLLDPGLLSRVGAVARKFSGKPISIVSGYRPRSRGSLHQSARAIDLRVAEVSNEDLVAFCKTLPDTGCGYYPNSSFVHVDVRLPGTGSVTWIDASGPGEPPRYVRAWPPPDDDAEAAAPSLAAGEPHDDKELAALGGGADEEAAGDDAKPAAKKPDAAAPPAPSPAANPPPATPASPPANLHVAEPYAPTEP
jgi:hypothetical protein